MKKKIFWLNESNKSGVGGIFFRAFDLIVFIKKIEIKHSCKVVGIIFDDSHNIELLTDKVLNN